MEDKPDSREKTLLERIAYLEARMADFKARVPAHSLPPGMMAELDELDEALAKAREELAALQQNSFRETAE